MADAADDTPKVIMILRPVDVCEHGARWMLGMVECPHCGQDHYSFDLTLGHRFYFCGVSEDRPTGWSKVFIQQVI